MRFLFRITSARAGPLALLIISALDCDTRCFNGMDVGVMGDSRNVRYGLIVGSAAVTDESLYHRGTQGKTLEIFFDEKWLEIIGDRFVGCSSFGDCCEL